MKHLQTFIFLVFVIFLAKLDSFAQDKIVLSRKDSLQLLMDSVKQITVDSLAKKKKNRDIETTVNYDAKDSIRFNVASQMMFMYGSSKVVYGKMSLTAETIDMNWKTNLVKANSRTDSTGKVIGKPVFTDRGEEYKIDAMTYNFKSRKGIISGIKTKQGEGFVLGNRVKKMPENEMFINEGLYTTCDLPHPHFGIRSRKLKVIPDKATISGLFNLEIAEVPLPLGFLFGIFPQPNRRKSGLLFPQYGETQTNGFFLQGGGIYLAFNDYIDLALTTEIHTKGRWGLNAASTYNKLYSYSGRFSMAFNRTLTEVDGSVNKAIADNFSVQWSHTPQSRGTSRFSSSVNFGTNNASRTMMLPGGDSRNFITSSLTSNVNYSKTFGQLFSFGASIAHNQNIITKVLTITPNANFSMNRVYPFKSSLKPNSKSLIRQLNVGYSGRIQAGIGNLVPNGFNGTTIKNDTLSFEPANFDRIFRNTQVSANHSIPISTSTTIAKYFNLNFSLNYNETWLLERYAYRMNNVSGNVENLEPYRSNRGGVITDTIRGFSRFYDYSMSAGTQTRLYATYFMKGTVEAIRHTMAPSINFSYSPDFSESHFGFYQNVATDSTGSRYQKKSIFPTFAGSPRQGVNGSIGFALDNTIEMKLKPKSDTVKTSRKVALLDNLGINGSYNLAADSMNLSNFNLSARTSLLKQINLNISATFDPYSYLPLAKDGSSAYRSRYYAWQKGNGLGTFTNINIGLSTNINRKAATKEYKAKTPEQQADVDFINRNRHLYVDFDIPWSLVVNYNLGYNHNLLTPNAEKNITQTLSFNGDVSLTKKWKVTYQSGWDFQANNFSFTQFAIARDLHCWQMNVTWIPFGPRTGFTFDINVKAAVLRDLKLSRRNNWYYR